MIDLQAADTRVFLFHTADAAADPGGAMDKVNTWLGRDRSGGQYANLRIRDISVTPDGRGGVFTTIVCSLGQAARAATEGAVPSI
ncbi:MAG: hypothetical protein AVDCRST_MAG49-1027 [uncultured Thermomicrobiales bacterium]|uniref:Uncharacterized protein n=1 Tax=uncultured Thermomicrobiales bacterium TaxID=1645740 RepID=A0A6J4U9W4_9BACT|nr:MAG: hypothetical protein AVDCRST_MAG49-1027 [uncultured Thermomicrobiales bacterium]